MPAIRKTITLIEQQLVWIKAQVQAGHYANDSACIRDLIRRDRAASVQVEVMRAALVEGENSGTPQVFDAQAFKTRMLTGASNCLKARTDPVE